MNTRTRRAGTLEERLHELPPGYTWKDLTVEQLKRICYAGESPRRVLSGAKPWPVKPALKAFWQSVTTEQARRIAAGERPESVVGYPMPR